MYNFFIYDFFCDYSNEWQTAHTHKKISTRNRSFWRDVKRAIERKMCTWNMKWLLCTMMMTPPLTIQLLLLSFAVAIATAAVCYVCDFWTEATRISFAIIKIFHLWNYDIAYQRHRGLTSRTIRMRKRCRKSGHKLSTMAITYHASHHHHRRRRCHHTPSSFRDMILTLQTGDAIAYSSNDEHLTTISVLKCKIQFGIWMKKLFPAE